MKNRLIILIATCLFAFNSNAQTKLKFSVSNDKLPFSDAVIVNNTIYVSGQVANLPGTLTIVEGGIKAETKQVMENLKRILEQNGSSLENVVKVTVMIRDMNEWAEMNEVYKQYFPNNKPARSSFGTTGLAFNAKVEIDCIAIIK